MNRKGFTLSSSLSVNTNDPSSFSKSSNTDLRPYGRKPAPLQESRLSQRVRRDHRGISNLSTFHPFHFYAIRIHRESMLGNVRMDGSGETPPRNMRGYGVSNLAFHPSIFAMNRWFEAFLDGKSHLCRQPKRRRREDDDGRQPLRLHCRG